MFQNEDVREALEGIDSVGGISVTVYCAICNCRNAFEHHRIGFVTKARRYLHLMRSIRRCAVDEFLSFAERGSSSDCLLEVLVQRKIERSARPGKPPH